MNKRNFEIVGADTDAIFFKNKDESIITQEEFDKLIDEINSYMVDNMILEDDGNYQNFVTVKAKNYVTREVGSEKIKYTGSSFKDSKKEPALREMMKEIIEKGLIHQTETPKSIYERYIKEVTNIKDISRWCVKKSITEKVFSSERANETKVVDAIEGKGCRIGDKVFLHNVINGKKQAKVKGELVFKKSGEPKLVDNCILRTKEDFDGNYDIKHYLKRCYSTISILSNVVDMDEILNYSLSKNINKVLTE